MNAQIPLDSVSLNATKQLPDIKSHGLPDIKPCERPHMRLYFGTVENRRWAAWQAISSFSLPSSLPETVDVPPEVWLTILLCFSTRQELLPVVLLSKASNAYARDPELKTILRIERDYSKHIKTECYRSFCLDFRPKSFVMLSSNAAILLNEDKLYLGSNLNQDDAEIKPLTGHTKLVTAVCVFQKNIVISSSEDKTVRVWNAEQRECVRTLEHPGSVTNVIKLNDSLIASTSGSEIWIWDIKKAESTTVLTETTGPIKAITKLPQKNLILVQTDRGITRWNIDTKESQHCSLSGIWSNHLLSDDSLMLTYEFEREFSIVSISSLFEKTFDENLLKRIKCPEGRAFRQLCNLSNGYVALLIADPRNWSTRQDNVTCVIYDPYQQKVIKQLAASLDIHTHLALLPNQQIAIFYRNYSSDYFNHVNEFKIFSFAQKEKNPVHQKELNMKMKGTDQNCVIS